LKRIDLADGSYLTGSSMNSMTLFPEERVVSVSIVNAVATLTTSGPEPEVVATVAVVKSDGGTSPNRSKKVVDHCEPLPSRRSDDAKRWTTLNEFEDCVARHLTPAEQIVWHHLFRWCRDGKVSASTRRVATMIGVDPKTVTAALATLKKAKLLWEIAISSHRGEASVYGMNGRPMQTVKACEAIARSREGRRPRRPK
jgi:hypothetical protein